jgi:hypothetical protein
MVICYYKDVNLTKNFVLSKIKKWIKGLNDRDLSNFCDRVNEIDVGITDRKNVVSYFTGPDLNILQAKNHYYGVESQGDFFND